MTAPLVGFAGMTHLGLNSAAACAERGFSTVCFDKDDTTIAALRAGKLPVTEPELDDMIAHNSRRLRFTADSADLASCDVVYIAPDVATDDNGASNLTTVRALVEEVRQALREDATLVILSQVPPGFCRAIAGNSARIFYQVETLIFGRAVERALHPERYIIGCADPTQPLPAHFRRVLEASECPILTMRYESAELAKIAINMFLVSSVSTTNTLAEICEKIGANWFEIAPALRLDRRIGAYAYLTPGLGIAGGNLERDLATIAAIGDAYGTDVGVVRAWRANSRHCRDWVLRKIYATGLGARDTKLSLLGLAYKENTHSTKNSPALTLLSDLTFHSVTVYDPVVAPQADWHPQLKQASSALHACQDADGLVITTPWPEFRKLSPSDIAAKLKGKIVIDPFACLDHGACIEADLIHLSLGTPA